MARDVFTYFHYPVVLGIILYAVAAKKTLEHPLDPLSDAGRWALGLGIAIFLVGFALMRFRVVHRVAWERLAAAALSLVVAVVLDGADAIATLGVVIVILVLSVALETRAAARGARRDQGRIAASSCGLPTVVACVHATARERSFRDE